jgi:hypothetical protein
MNQLRGWLFVGAALVALTGLVAVGLRRPTGPDPPGPSGTTIDVEEEWARGQQLEVESKAAVATVAAKADVMAQVLDGRLSLTEAAARFRDLDDRNPGFVRDAFEQSWPGRSDAERYARAVLNHLHIYIRDHPDRDPEAILPLETELDRLLRGEESSGAGAALREAP